MLLFWLKKKLPKFSISRNWMKNKIPVPEPDPQLRKEAKKKPNKKSSWKISTKRGTRGEHPNRSRGGEDGHLLLSVAARHSRSKQSKHLPRQRRPGGVNAEFCFPFLASHSLAPSPSHAGPHSHIFRRLVLAIVNFFLDLLGSPFSFLFWFWLALYSQKNIIKLLTAKTKTKCYLRFSIAGTRFLNCHISIDGLNYVAENTE